MKALNKRKEESGQILVILTVGIVALLAITALALDAGMIYSDRRYDQNAADASAYSGGGAAAQSMENTSPLFYNDFNCINYNNRSTPGIAFDAYDAAILSAQNRASSNNFLNLPEDDPIVTGVDGEYGVEVICRDTPGTLFGQKYMDVHVMISSSLQTAFAHLFYGGPVRNTVEATVRVYTPNDTGWGYGLASLDQDCSGTNGLIFEGTDNRDIILKGAGAHSNSCIRRNGNVDVYTVPANWVGTDPSVSMSGRPSVIYQDSPNGYIDNGHGDFIAHPTQDPEIMPSYYLEDHGYNPLINSCPDQGAGNTVINHTAILEPGTFKSISITNGEDLTLKGGIYCIKENFSVNGGMVRSVPNTDPSSDYFGYDGVTFLLLKDGNKEGSMTITGGTIDLRAPSGSKITFAHLLVYAAKDNTSSNNLLGNGSSYYEGTILAPDAYIKLGGSTTGVSGPRYTTQVIGWDVRVAGTATLNLVYDGSKVFTTGALIYLQK